VRAAPRYNKRPRKAAELLRRVKRLPATDTTVWIDNVWSTDSTPVERGRSRETVNRSDLTGCARYGYARATAASSAAGPAPAPGVHLSGFADRIRPDRGQGRRTRDALDLLAAEPELMVARPEQTLIGDKNYLGRDFEHQLAELHLRLLRSPRKPRCFRHSGYDADISRAMLQACATAARR
jgi:hypothetical protein